jgi:hypothetical protein
VITVDALAGFDVVAFVNTTGDVLDDRERGAARSVHCGRRRGLAAREVAKAVHVAAQ